MYGSWLEKDLQCWPPPPSSWGCGQQPSQRWPLSCPPSGWVRPKHHHWQRGCTRQWGWAPSSWEVTGMAITCCCGKCPIRSWHLWLSLTGSKKCSIFWNPWKLRPCTWLCNLMRTKGSSSSRSYREQWAFSSISTLWAFLLRPHSLLPSWHPWSRPSVIFKCRVLCILSLQGSFSIQRVSRVPVGTPTRVGQRVSSHLASKKRGSVAQSSIACSLGLFCLLWPLFITPPMSISTFALIYSFQRLRTCDNFSAVMATPQAIFTDLCARFELADAVRDQIVGMGISSLSEFRYYVTAAAELEALFITPIRDLDNRRLQLARLRHCWSATVAAEAQRESSSSTPLQLDEDECLPASQITGIRDMFWARYHLVYPPEFTPSDRVITKAQRALAKRSLEVIDLWQVRSIANQRIAQACCAGHLGWRWSWRGRSGPSASLLVHLPQPDEALLLVLGHGWTHEAGAAAHWSWECYYILHGLCAGAFGPPHALPVPSWVVGFEDPWEAASLSSWEPRPCRACRVGPSLSQFITELGPYHCSCVCGEGFPLGCASSTSSTSSPSC